MAQDSRRHASSGGVRTIVDYVSILPTDRMKGREGSSYRRYGRLHMIYPVLGLGPLSELGGDVMCWLAKMWS